MSTPTNPRMDAVLLEMSRLHLPFDNPARHDLDPLDVAFAHLAPGYPDTSNPVDYANSVAKGFIPPVEWAATPARRTTTTPTGDVL